MSRPKRGLAVASLLLSCITALALHAATPRIIPLSTTPRLPLAHGPVTRLTSPGRRYVGAACQAGASIAQLWIEDFQPHARTWIEDFQPHARTLLLPISRIVDAEWSRDGAAFFVNNNRASHSKRHTSTKCRPQPDGISFRPEAKRTTLRGDYDEDSH
jgi:hypothetical protein